MSVLEAFLAGKEARRQADAAEQVNRMQAFLAQNGQAIFQGDSNALGQLAGMGPQGLETAMSLRNANDQRAAALADRERQSVMQGRQDQEWQWKVEEYAASKTAAERQAEAAKIEEGVKMAMMAQTPEQFDAIVTQGGMPEYAGMFDQREMLAARFMTVAEILKQNAGPEPLSPQAKFEADKKAGLLPPDAVYKGDAPAVNVNLPGQSKFDDEFAKLDAQSLNTIATSGLAASRNIGRIEQLDKLLASAGSGAGAELQRLAGEIGLDLGEGTSDIQAAQAIINSLVPEQRQPGSGPMSDADLALFKRSLPRIINQPGGNQLIIGTMKAIAQYDAEGAKIVQRLRAGEIDRATAFELLQQRPNPLEGFNPPPEGAAEQPQQPAPSGGDTGEIPQSFLANPTAKAAAEKAGVAVEDLWEFLSPEARARLAQ